MADILKPINPTLTYFLGFKEKEDDYEITDEKTGQVKSGHYHNFIVGLAEAFEPNEKSRIGFIGLEPNIYKIKADYFPYIFGEQPQTFNPQMLADKTFKPCEVLYDKRGNIKSIRFIDNARVVLKED